MTKYKFIEEADSDTYTLAIFYYKIDEVYAENKVHIKQSDLKTCVNNTINRYEQFEHECTNRHYTYHSKFGDFECNIQIDEEHVNLIVIYNSEVQLRFECINHEYFKIVYYARGMTFTIAKEDVPAYFLDTCKYISLLYDMTWETRFRGAEV